MSENQNEPTCSNSSDVDDLNELLKSALSDFDNPVPSIKEPISNVKKKKDEKIESSCSKLQEDFEKKFNSLLSNDVDDVTFANKMKELLNETTNDIKSFSDMPDDNENGTTDVMSQAINSLVKNMAEIKDNMDTDQLQNNFNLDELKNGDMFPVMEQMFQLLISKEVLYPSLAAVKEQYPTWIEENKDKIAAEETDRYTKQYHVIQKICMMFENEKESEPEDIKKKRFIELLGLFEQMTELGQPPKDLAESLPSMPLGNDLAMANDMPDNCNTM